MTPPKMLTVSKRDDVTVIALGPDREHIDEDRITNLQEVILEAIQTADPPLVVIDLPHTNSFTSSFIVLLLHVWSRLKIREGRRFAISGLTAHCQEVIQRVQLHRFCDIFESQDEAVRVLSNS